MKKRTIHLKTWQEFKKRAVAQHPQNIAYFLYRVSLSKLPIGLKRIFTSKQTQYVFWTLSRVRPYDRQRSSHAWVDVWSVS
jgi:hypothetical protein